MVFTVLQCYFAFEIRLKIESQIQQFSYIVAFDRQLCSWITISITEWEKKILFYIDIAFWAAWMLVLLRDLKIYYLFCDFVIFLLLFSVVIALRS